MITPWPARVLATNAPINIDQDLRNPRGIAPQVKQAKVKRVGFWVCGTMRAGRAFRLAKAFIDNG